MLICEQLIFRYARKIEATFYNLGNFFVRVTLRAKFRVRVTFKIKARVADYGKVRGVVVEIYK